MILHFLEQTIGKCKKETKEWPGEEDKVGSLPAYYVFAH
jgi:hypothetical protein